MKLKRKVLQVKPLRRDITFGRHYTEKRADDTDTEDRLVEITFSSEEPELRQDWFGDSWIEILDHDPTSVRLERIQSVGISLFNHDVDQPVATPERVWIENRKGKAVLRFGKTDRANEIWQLIDDGILKGVSVWYRIYERTMESEKKGEPTVYRVTDWEPMEIGPVSVPADASVGIGRSREDDKNECITLYHEEEKKMEYCQFCGKPVNECTCEAGTKQRAATPTPTPTPAPIAPTVDVKDIRKEEMKRQGTINAIAKKWGLEEAAETYISEGRSIASFREHAMEEIGKKQADPPASPTPRKIGMDSREIDGFSFLRLANALATPANRSAQEMASMELEACEEWSKRSGQSSGQAGQANIPPDVLYSRNFLKRDVTVATEGADLRPTVHDAGNFIELLRNTTPVTSLATILSGLTGDLLIPRQATGVAASFKAEATAVTEGTPTFDQLLLQPKKLGAFTDISLQSIIQFNPAIENLVRSDLLKAVGQKLEDVSIEGAGSNEPTGITQTSGIGSVSVSSSAIDWPAIVNLEREVATDNALMGRLAYLSTASVKAQMKRIEMAASTGQFLFDRQTPAAPVNGYPFFATGNVPSDLGAGALSACIFGNFEDLLIGIWDMVSILVDPYTLGKEGLVRIIINHFVDVGIRHPESFAACLDIDATQ